jgi:hypothetical protein
MRKAEGINQNQLSEMTNIPWGTVRNIEQNGNGNFAQIRKIFDIERFKRYLLWFFYGETNPALGQISPTQLSEVKDKLIEKGLLENKSDVVSNELLAEHLEGYEASTTPEVTDSITKDMTAALTEILHNHGLR